MSKRWPIVSHKDMKKECELQKIPGVGPNVARDFIELGFFRISDLKDQNPELMYERLCEIRQQHIDRCVLYVFREAVYYASNEKHNPALLKWWNWKDRYFLVS